MKKLYRWLVLFVLMFMAFSFYSYGNTTGMIIFVILGFLFEGAFWLSLFDRKNK